MALPLIVVSAILSGAAFGGILWFGHERAKLKNGDTALVPAKDLTLASALAVPMKIDALSAQGLVRVENVQRGPSTRIAGGVSTATGTAGKELGISVQLKFPVTAAVTIERSGQQFPNPEMKV
jgi:hypothetical protein